MVSRRQRFDGMLSAYWEGRISKGEVLAFLSEMVMDLEKIDVDKLWIDNHGFAPV